MPQYPGNPSQFKRTYEVGEPGFIETYGSMRLHNFLSVTGNPQLSGNGVITVSMPKDNPCVAPICEYLLVDGEFPRALRFWTRDYNGVTIGNRTFYIEGYNGSDYGYDTITFRGHYSANRLSHYTVPVPPPGSDGYLPVDPVAPQVVLNSVLTAMQAKGMASNVTITPHGILKEAKVEAKTGDTLLAILDNYVSQKILHYIIDEIDIGDGGNSELTVHIYPWSASGIVAGDAGISQEQAEQNARDRASQIVFQRQVVARQTDREIESEGYGTTLIVVGKYGTYYEKTHPEMLAARRNNREEIFEKRDDIFEQWQMDEYGDRKLESIARNVPSVRHSNLRTDVPGTPIPGQDFDIGTLVTSYTLEGDHREILTVQRVDESVVHNGDVIEYSVQLGRDLREIEPIKLDPPAEDTLPPGNDVTIARDEEGTPVAIPTGSEGAGLPRGAAEAISSAVVLASAKETAEQEATDQGTTLDPEVSASYDQTVVPVYNPGTEQYEPMALDQAERTTVEMDGTTLLSVTYANVTTTGSWVSDVIELGTLTIFSVLALLADDNKSLNGITVEGNDDPDSGDGWVLINNSLGFYNTGWLNTAFTHIRVRINATATNPAVYKVIKVKGVR